MLVEINKIKVKQGEIILVGYFNSRGLSMIVVQVALAIRGFDYSRA
jgi:hypothetical protein